MGRGEMGDVPRSQGVGPAAPRGRCAPAQVAVHLSVVSRVISLARVNHDAAHRREMPKVDVAIRSFCPRKKEGDPPPSPSLLPLGRFNAS